MAEEFDHNKTEAPTPRRREKAREDGQVVFSTDLNSTLILLLTACAALWLAPLMATHLQSVIRSRIQLLDGSHFGTAATVLSARWLLEGLWGIAGGVCICLTGLSLIISQAQTGFLVTIKPLAPNWERLSPVKGFERLFSMESAMRGLLALVKVASLLAVAAVVSYAWRRELATGTMGSLNGSVETGWDFIRRLLLSMAGAGFVWGLADFGFKWLRHERRLRMSREDVKDEQKEEQGNPQVKGRLRKMQQEAAQRKSLQEVPRASVVITNPTHFAVALKYEPGGRMKAPRVVAKGHDGFARRIIETARRNGVPVREHKPLARALYALAEVGKEIPLEFYRAVAEILAQVYRLKNSA